ncbi:hypothetical protein DFP93_11274 [Aneurinibacillus soli]|uniref:Uncharacterized protein n=1 Tax=Aneurinibacillus soli TaxID=1500254 RepID=A0A0U5B560_9BACL|nr:hypothetical protein [Aneurinibacillus soli]PYE60634.1 hypothetical protein DFP93_11274 [Aneurinibacillus soli]BAU29842.1 hypothetical protein CB4_04096 [Aneurinibacillus soli]
MDVERKVNEKLLQSLLASERSIDQHTRAVRKLKRASENELDFSKKHEMYSIEVMLRSLDQMKRIIERKRSLLKSLK